MLGLVPAPCAEDLEASVFEPLLTRDATQRKKIVVALCAPGVWACGIRFITPEESDTLVPVHADCDVLAHETNALCSVDLAVGLLQRISHEA